MRTSRVNIVSEPMLVPVDARRAVCHKSREVHCLMIPTRTRGIDYVIGPDTSTSTSGTQNVNQACSLCVLLVFLAPQT